MCSTCDCEKNLIKGVDQEVIGNDELCHSKCRKCGAKPFIILNKVHIECQNCFLNWCDRKVKSTIGKSQLIKKNDSILIAHSGGPSSTALLSLLKDSINNEQRCQQKFRPSILHIDTRLTLGMDFEQCRKERLLHLSRILEQTHNMCPEWPLYWTTLEVSLSSQDAIMPLFSKYEPKSMLTDLNYDFLLNNVHLYRKFQNMVQKQKDLTEKQSYIRKSTTALIDMVARAFNVSNTTRPLNQFKFVLMASSATRLANDLLVNVILGEGSTIASTVNVCDYRPQVPIIRPMRDFSKKEIAFYLRAKCLEFYLQQNIATLADHKASIQKVTESFLNKLHTDYPSTFSNLLRIGNKMQD